MQVKKTRNRKTTKAQMSARVKKTILTRIDSYIERMELNEVTVRKIDIIETALHEYMEKMEKIERELKW